MGQNKQLNSMKSLVLGKNARARKGDWAFAGFRGGVDANEWKKGEAIVERTQRNIHSGIAAQKKKGVANVRKLEYLNSGDRSKLVSRIEKLS